MSMSIQTGDDIDEVDDDLERDDDDDRDDEPRKGKPKGRQADEEPDEDDDDEDEDKSPEELKAEAKRLRAAVSKSNSGSQRVRTRNKELRARIAELEGKAQDVEDEDEDDEEKPKQKAVTKGLDAKAAQRMVTKAVSQRERELQAEHKRDLIDTRAESAFIKAGVSEKNIRLLKRELDYDELELDPKTRSVEGLEDEVDRLKQEYPDFFRGAKGTRRRINGGDEREAGGRRKKPMTATERQVALLEGRG